MFTADESPARVATTPAATAELAALAAEQGGVTVLLSDDRARVLRPDQHLPEGSVHLGRLPEREDVTFAADRDTHTVWWRNRAVIDLTDSRGQDRPALTFRLAPLDEDELYAALASGPLPRY